MKKHLRILYGCDDRFEITSGTAKVCLPYFDTIKILNAGLHEFYQRLRDGVPPEVKIQQLHRFLEIESSRRALIDDVPQGEWVLWLDADERPSKELLADLDKVVTHYDQGGYDIIRLIWAEHTNGVPTPIKMPIPSADDLEKHGGGGYFMAKRFTKIKPGIRIISHFGAHEEFVNEETKLGYAPYLIHHHKSTLQYCQSVVLSGFMNPMVHANVSTPERFKAFLEFPQFKALKEFQRKHRVFTSNDLVKKLKVDKDTAFKEELKTLFMSFPDTLERVEMDHKDVLITFKFMREFAEKHDLNVQSPHYPCGRDCCKYGDIQL